LFSLLSQDPGLIHHGLYSMDPFVQYIILSNAKLLDSTRSNQPSRHQETYQANTNNICIFGCTNSNTPTGQVQNGFEIAQLLKNIYKGSEDSNI
jgi:hypothetical protein